MNENISYFKNSEGSGASDVSAERDRGRGNLDGLFPNNFDLIRHILAFIVVIVHARVLSRSEALTPFVGNLNSHYAVMGFFAVSGLLITRSCVRAVSLRKYFENRVRRLMPAYLFFLVTALILASLFSTVGFTEFWTTTGTYRYMAANVTFLQFLEPGLPGIFIANPATDAVNGSLWSIRTELFCYLLVPFYVWFVSRTGRAIACAAAVAASLAGVLLFLTPLGGVGAAIAGQIKIGVAMPVVSFAAGAVCFYYWGYWQRYRWVSAGLIAGCLLLHYLLPDAWWNDLLMPLVVSGMVLWAGTFFPYVGNWTPAGDLSYGIYIYHFPIVQSLVTLGWYQTSPLLSLVATLVITVAVAMVSWRLIEGPALSRESYYLHKWRKGAV